MLDKSTSHFQLRPFTNKDYKGIVSLQNALYPDHPKTVEMWQHHDKTHKDKIREAESDRLNRLDAAKKIIEKKLKEEEKNRRLIEEQERKVKADETRKIQVEEVRKSEEIEKENLKAMEERMSSNPQEKINSYPQEQEKKD